jgi:excisionase family DNA binding protein
MARKRTPPDKGKEHLSTGEAAALCAVTPDTVLKWIQAGKITAHRTPGGHHRIPRSVLLPLIEQHEPAGKSTDGGEFQYCWEFNSVSGKIPDGCRNCIVYRSGTKRCYEMTTLPSQAGYVGLFCGGSCEDCDYYHLVKGQRPNVLIVTSDVELKVTLMDDLKDSELNLKFADTEYRCSMFIERFRPDYLVVDCSMGPKQSRSFCKHLYEDPRIPFVRVILVGDRSHLPSECDKMVFAMIEGTLRADTLTDLIAGSHTSSRGMN